MFMAAVCMISRAFSSDTDSGRVNSQKMLPIQSWRLSLSRLMMAARHP